MSFRPTLPRLKGPSSKIWLARHFDDPFVRNRHLGAHGPSQAYRSRSAFKLLNIDDSYRRFLRAPHVRAVVDLGAAPGGWSQVVAGFMGFRDRVSDDPELRSNLRGTDTEAEGWGMKSDAAPWSSSEPRAKKSYEGSRRGAIVAVDRLHMHPIPGVHSLKMDFLSPEAGAVIGELLRAHANAEGKADVILSDMAANATGNRITDIQNSLDICRAVWEFAGQHLRTAKSIGKKDGGVLLMKFFQHPDLQTFRQYYLNPHFEHVLYVKPEASRSDSSEGYWLCMGYKGL